MKNIHKKINFNFGERIAKRIASSGVCSRREAEKLIIEGKVKLNDKIVFQCNLNVSKNDLILVDGKSIPKKEPIRLWLFYKEKGFLVTNNDPQGRPTIFEKINSKVNIRMIAIGRLDLNSEGLLLLTNNGELARKLELPKNGFIRKYKVRVFGQIDEKKLKILKKGIEIDGFKYKSILAKLQKQQKSNAWISMAFKEGKNREIRKIMSHFGYPVNKLIRISYGPFSLNSLKPGDLIEIEEKKINEILKSSFSK